MTRMTRERRDEIREIALIRREMGIFEAPVFIEELLAELDTLEAIIKEHENTLSKPEAKDTGEK